MTEITTTSKISVKLIDKCGGDKMIAAAAKVLEPDAYEEYLQTHDDRSVDGLLRYLIQHRHGTPFEHSFMSSFNHAPIFVWREWHRHRIGHSYNEESGRYKTLAPVFYLPPRDRPMFKVDNWKPGRPKFMTIAEYDKFIGKEQGENRYLQLCGNLTESYKLAYAMYEQNLSLDVDPGLARDCLPVGIYSSCWVSVNPRSLMAFLSLRTHDQGAKFVSYPLYEIEVAARLTEAIFAKFWPISYKAFNDFGRVAP